MLSLRRLFALLGGALLALFLALMWTINIGRADNNPGWLAPASLNLQKQADLSAVPFSINGNIDCYPEPSGACALSTAYGTADTTGAVTLGDSSAYHPVVSNIDGRQHFIAIPNSSQFITYTTDPAGGFYFYFNGSFLGSVSLKNEGLGAYYQVNRPPDGILADKTQHKLAGDYGSVSFSENGQWMIVSDPNVAVLRVNLRTFEVLPFAPGFDYSIGLSPAVKTAISNDGRYAVIASKNYGRFSIYDLDTCGAAPDTISGPVNCASRDLQGLVSQSVPGLTSVSNLRFLGDAQLGLYAGYTENNANKTAKYILTNGTAIANQHDYLALGDSYISGEGAFKYLSGTDTADNKCHVSEISYPLLIGRELDYNSYHSVACSGATTKDILDASDDYAGQTVARTPRYKRDVPSILSNFQTGYINQLDFVKQYQPQAITISIGGNDIGFSARLRQCLGLSSCYGSYEDRFEFVNEVNQAFPKLVNTYAQLKAQGAANARIYVIGYPQIAKADGDCALNVHLSHDDLAFAEQAIDYIDRVVKAAAQRAGVFYVDTQNALVSHRLCEAKPGSVAINGITAGNDFPDKLGGPIGRESFHPNDFGHLLLDNAVRAATHDLTDPMPSPDTLANLPNKNSLDILNAPKSGRPVNRTEYDSALAPDLVYNQTAFNISISADDHALTPGTVLTAELHSALINLGKFTTGASGDLNTQLTLPATVSAGFHSLDFYGTDINGQPVEIFKQIYVAPSPDDLDGNGVPDSQQRCVGVAPAGQDFDQDGVDDSCDSDISLPPAEPSQPIAVTGSISLLTPDLVAFTSASGAPAQATSQIAFTASSQINQPQVLAASTTRPSNEITDQNLRLSPRIFLAVLGALLVVSFALSLA